MVDFFGRKFFKKRVLQVSQFKMKNEKLKIEARISRMNTNWIGAQGLPRPTWGNGVKLFLEKSVSALVGLCRRVTVLVCSVFVPCSACERKMKNRV